MGRIEFLGFCFDVKAEQLTFDGEEIQLRPKTLRLLSFLLDNPSRVIGKEEMMAAVWPGRIVTDDSLTQCVKELRRALGPSAESLIRTAHGRGYSVDGRLLTIKQQFATEKAFLESEPSRLTTVVGVSATRDLSQDGAYSWLAAGITDDVVTALSRIPQLVVLHPAPYFNSDSELKAWSANARADFVLTTSLRVAGGRLRLSARIVDTRSIAGVWSENFDSPLEDIFDVQDEIARRIALTAQSQLTYGQLAQLWEGATKSLPAWAEMCAGRSLYLKFNTSDVERAKTHLAHALQIDPTYTGAMIQLGLCHYYEARFNTSLDRDTCLGEAEKMAQAAFAITPGLPTAHMLMGGLSFLRDRHDEAVAECRLAVGLSPSDSWAVAYCGLVNVYAGNPSEALELVARARRLSPRPPAWYTYVETLARLAAGNLATAEEVAIANLGQEPGDTSSYVNLALAFGLQNKVSEAQSVVRQLRLHFPTHGMKGFLRSERYRDVSYRDRLVAVLRRAGLPG